MIYNIFQQTINSTEGELSFESPIFYVILGIFLTLAFFFLIKLFEYKQKLASRPFVILEDFSTDIRIGIGYFVKRVDFKLPSIEGKLKSFWAVQCTNGNETFFIIPSHGEYEDLVKRYDHLPSIIFIEGKFLGYGNSGPEVHREWIESAFPKSLFKFNEIGPLPSNYILCKPHYSVGIKKEIHRNEINKATNIYTLLQQIKLETQAEIEIIQQKYNELMLTSQQTNISHMFSHWESILAMNDAMLRQFTTPLYVIARLLHIRSDHVGISGLNHAVSQGSFTAMAEIIKNYKTTMDNILDSLGSVALPKDTLEMTFEKANKTKDEALAAMARNQQLESQMQELIAGIKSGKYSNSNSQENINM